MGKRRRRNHHQSRRHPQHGKNATDGCLIPDNRFGFSYARERGTRGRTTGITMKSELVYAADCSVAAGCMDVR